MVVQRYELEQFLAVADSISAFANGKTTPQACLVQKNRSAHVPRIVGELSSSPYALFGIWYLLILR